MPDTFSSSYLPVGVPWRSPLITPWN